MAINTTYDSLEDALLGRLSTLKTAGFEVETLPGRPADYVKTFKNSRVTITCRASSFEEPFQGSPRPQIRTTSATVAQTETCKVDIVLESKLLRGATGIYAMRQAVEKRVLGYAPRPWTPFYLLAFGYEGHGEGVWTYVLTFSTTVFKVADVDQVDEVLITEINQNFV